jgi:hypothetical protein
VVRIFDLASHAGGTAFDIVLNFRSFKVFRSYELFGHGFFDTSESGHEVKQVIEQMFLPKIVSQST